MKTQKIKLEDLVIDDKLTDLRKIDVFAVSRYRQAYRSGANMPKITIEEMTNRVILGNHRTKAMLAEYNKDKVIEVFVKKYKNEREVLEHFARDNATHGQPMDGFTIKKISLALVNEGANEEEISKILGVPVKKIVKGCENVVMVDTGSGNISNPKFIMKPIKQGLDLSSGKKVTLEQYKEHDDSDCGVSVTQMANQLTRWLNNGWVKNSEKNIECLINLTDAIYKFLPKM